MPENEPMNEHNERGECAGSEAAPYTAASSLAAFVVTVTTFHLLEVSCHAYFFI